MEKIGEGTTTQNIVIFGKRIRVGRENNGCVSDENGNDKGAKRTYTKSRTPRIRWTVDLHRTFLRAIQQLGGPYRASPKQLIKLMGVQGLTLSQLKSHLQMYRNSIKLGKNEQDSQGEESERKRDSMLVVEQGSSLIPHSKQTSSTLQAAQYKRDITTYYEFGHTLQLQKPTWKLPQSNAGLFLAVGVKSQVITSDKLQDEGDWTPFSKSKYKKHMGWQRFISSVDDKAPSSQIALDLKL